MLLLFDILLRHIPPAWEQSANGWLRGNCPLCTAEGERRPDTKKRGGIMLTDKSIGYHCFNCGFRFRWEYGYNLTANLKKMLRAFDVTSEQLFEISADLKKCYYTKGNISNVQTDEVSFSPDYHWREKTLPPLFIRLTESSESVYVKRAVAYLKKRGFFNVDSFYCDSFDKNLINKVIIPFYYKNKFVGYTARNYNDEFSCFNKYYSSQPLHYIFNLDVQYQANRKFLIVVEGAFDALSIDGVAVLSNAINDEQCKIINRLKIPNVILLPDRDKAGTKMIGTAIKQGWQVSFPEWERKIKDANMALTHYGKLFTINSIIASAVSGATNIELRRNKF